MNTSLRLGVVLVIVTLGIAGCVKDDLVWDLPEQPLPPTIITGGADQITNVSAEVSGNLQSNGGSTVVRLGICYSADGEPDTNDNVTTVPAEIGEFSTFLSGLSPDVTYRYRSFVETEQGNFYGETKEFTTTNFQADLPTVTTGAVESVETNSATGSGSIEDDGGVPIILRGLCVGLTSSPDISNGIVFEAGTGVGDFTVPMTGLEDGTTYFLRAFGTNAMGTSYGNEVSFTTVLITTVAEVETTTPSDIEMESATCGGNVISDGGAPVTQRGVCLGNDPNPSLDNTVFSAGKGSGAFSIPCDGLAPGTTYHVRAFATNSNGTAFGDDLEFSTPQAPSIPTVQTDNVTSIGLNDALGAGNVTDEGGLSVTARGICLSSDPDPDVNDLVFPAGNGSGAFTASLTGLESGSTYYVRAYATNSLGTAYGSETSFTTITPSIPSVQTGNVSSVGLYDAMGSGNVTDDGWLAVTARGICLSSDPQPDLNDVVYSSGSGLGNYSVSLTGLEAGSTYYVRAFATNSLGTAYGTQVSFTTITPTIPSVQTGDVSSIGIYNAVGAGTVTDDGWLSVTGRGICLSTNPQPDLNDVVYPAGSGLGSFSTSLTGLDGGTTYYVRAYATNSVGTAYGIQVVFNTEPPPPAIVDQNDCSSLAGVSSYYEGMNDNTGTWGIGNSGYSGTCWEAPDPDAWGQLGTAIGTHYVEFTQTFQNNGFIEFWLNTFNAGFDNIMPSITVDGILQPTPTMIGGGTSGFDWMQVRTSDISGGTHTIRITFVGSYYVFRIDEIDFYEYQ